MVAVTVLAGALVKALAIVAVAAVTAADANKQKHLQAAEMAFVLLQAVEAAAPVRVRVVDSVVLGSVGHRIGRDFDFNLEMKSNFSTHTRTSLDFNVMYIIARRAGLNREIVEARLNLDFYGRLKLKFHDFRRAQVSNSSADATT